MIVIVKDSARPEQIEKLKENFESMGLQVHFSKGMNTTLLGLVGDTTSVDIGKIASLDIVEEVKRIQEPYKKANRKFHPEDSVVDVDGVKIGGGSFQGLHGEGIKLLLEAKKQTGLPIVTEIMNYDDIDLFEEVDVIQVGARNMQNFELLKQLGKLNKPILLKRGLANTIEEWLMSAEYIMAGGNENVILCERGIRTFETKTRNTLDLSAVPMIKKLSHLPVIIDPSHATGLPWMVEPMTLAAIAAGADGVMIEVHNDPPKALCDGAQSLRPDQFAELMQKVKKLSAFMKTL